MDSAKHIFSLKSAFNGLILPYIVFGGMALQSIRLIVNNYGVEGEEWRIACASVALALFSLFLIAPFWAKAYVKRRLEAKKKGRINFFIRPGLD